MKQKLYNFLHSKNLWSSILELICAIMLLLIGYFSGFVNGLFVDDTIRTEIIEKTLDESKINKKSRNLNELEYDAIPYGSNIQTDIIVDIGLIVQNMIEYKEDLYSYCQSNMPYQTYVYPLFMTLDLFDITNNYYNAHIYSITRYSTSIALRVENRRCIIGVLPNGDNYLRSYTSYTSDNIFSIKEDLTFSYSSYFDWAVAPVYTNTYYDSLQVFSSFTSSTATTYTFGTYNLQLFDICNIGAYFVPNSNATAEELEQAYQSGINIGYQSGLIEGANEFKSSQEYQDNLNAEFERGKDEGYDIGYQDRKDSVADTDATINRIWSILEKAIASALNVLSMEILPGIPLYICVGVPILLAVLLWFIKMGQS